MKSSAPKAPRKRKAASREQREPAHDPPREQREPPRGHAGPELPFWHGILWDPLPFAEVTQWMPDDENPLTNLNDLIRDQREKIGQLGPKYIPMLTGLRNNISRMIAERLHQPYHRVFRVHYERLVAEIDARIEDLKSRKDLVHFESNIQPFVLAHAGEVVQPPDPTKMSNETLLMSRMKQAIGLALPPHHRHQEQAHQETLIKSMLSRLWVQSHAGISTTNMKHDVCSTCSIPLIKSTREQMLVCPSCGFSISYLDSTEAARTYGDEVEFTVTTSHRYNHWQEFVTRSQAREVKAVPRPTLSRIALRLKEQGCAKPDDITLQHVVRVVHELSLKDFKRNIVQIHARLTGKWPKQLTAEQLFVAKGMFFEILNTFELLFPDEKWFRNKYCMSVICHTMGWSDMLEVFALSAIEHGEIQEDDSLSFPQDHVQRMQAIFKHLGWVYRGPMGSSATPAHTPAT